VIRASPSVARGDRWSNRGLSGEAVVIRSERREDGGRVQEEALSNGIQVARGFVRPFGQSTRALLCLC